MDGLMGRVSLPSGICPVGQYRVTLNMNKTFLYVYTEEERATTKCINVEVYFLRHPVVPT